MIHPGAQPNDINSKKSAMYEADVGPGNTVYIILILLNSQQDGNILGLMHSYSVIRLARGNANEAKGEVKII